MKPHLDIAHEGTIGSDDRIAMTFDENSIAHLMNILIDLYSDRPLAVIREYSTNAWDAHLAAGHRDPIEVTLPTILNPTFIVKDHGIGMSLKTVTEEFSKYGWSSKRDDDEATGMLGLGCKSGLTYASQFTFIATQNGIRATVLVTRNEIGAGALQVMDTCQTSDPDGVEVQIPVDDVPLFVNKAREFYRFWDPGTVTIDGVLSECVWDDATAIYLDPDIAVMPKLNASYIVMGQVPYMVNYGEIKSFRQDRYGVVVRVPVGTINFTPSREQLDYTRRTKDTIHEINQFIKHTLMHSTQAKIDAAPTATKAWLEYEEWRTMLRSAFGNAADSMFTYRKAPFPESFEIDKMRSLSVTIEGPQWDRDNSTRWTGREGIGRYLKLNAIVYGHMGTAVSGPTKERMRKYMHLRGVTKGEVLFVPRRIGGGWLDDILHIDYEDIKKVYLPPKEDDPKAKREKTKYRYLSGSSYGQTLDTEDWEPTCVCWVAAGDKKIKRDTVWNFCEAIGVKCAVVLASESKRFKREHPFLPEFREWWFKALLDEFKKADDVDRFLANGGLWNHGRDVLGYDNYLQGGTYPSFFTQIDPDKVLDPEIKDIHRALTEMHVIQEGEYGYKVGGDNTIKRARKYSRSLGAAWNSATEVKRMLTRAGESCPAIPTIGGWQRFHDKLHKVIKKYELIKASDRSNVSTDVLIEAINALYIVHESLHVIPVY